MIANTKLQFSFRPYFFTLFSLNSTKIAVFDKTTIHHHYTDTKPTYVYPTCTWTTITTTATTMMMTTTMMTAHWIQQHLTKSMTPEILCTFFNSMFPLQFIQLSNLEKNWATYSTEEETNTAVIIYGPRVFNHL